MFPTGDASWDAAQRRMTKMLVHDECADKESALIEARRKSALEEANAKQWDTLCPAEFRKEIKFAKQYSSNKKLFDRIYAWRANQGLWVHGRPGRCKTRFVWASLKKFFPEQQIFAISHSAFRQRITGLASSEQHELIRWMFKLVSVRLLFIDDFGKGNTTNASEEGMFDLLNARYEKQRVTVFTSEFTRAEAAARFSAERAGSIQRRLEEMTEDVNADEF